MLEYETTILIAHEGIILFEEFEEFRVGCEEFQETYPYSIGELMFTRDDSVLISRGEPGSICCSESDPCTESFPPGGCTSEESGDALSYF